MIAKDSILQEQDSPARSYRLTRFLGSGSYSDVYEAELLEQGQMQPRVVAAKIGRVRDEDRQSEEFLEKRIVELRDRYEKEASFVARLRQESNGRFAPWMCPARLVKAEPKEEETDGKLPIYFMQRIGEECILTRRVKPGTAEVDEILGIEAGAQYAELLTILHGKIGATCGDRKSDDIRWDNGCLYVLDWNVTERLSEDPTRALRTVQRDIRIFGRLWFQVLVGREPESLGKLPLDNPVAGSSWAMISRGTRRLLVATALKSIDGRGFTSAEAVRDAWNRWLNYLRDSKEALLKAADVLCRDEVETRDWQEQWERVADLVELAERRGARPEELASLQSWLGDRPQRQRQAFEDMFRLVRSSLEYGDYRRAKEMLEQLRRDEWPPEYRLRIARWYWISDILMTLVPDETSKGEVYKMWEALVGALEGQDRGRVGSESALTRCQNWVRNRLATGKQAKGMEMLACEAAYWQALEQARKTDDIEQRLRHYERARDELARMKDADPYYATVLSDVQAGVPLDDLVDTIKEQVQVEEGARDSLRKVEEELRTAAEAEQPQWPFPSAGYFASLPDDARRNMVTVHWAATAGLNQALLDAEEAAQSALHMRYPSLAEALREWTVRAVQANLRYRVQYARWPDEVREAKSLLASARRAGLLSSELDQQLQQQLDGKEELQLRLRQEMGESPNWETALSKIRGGGNLVELLLEADRQGIEFRERWGAGEWTVRHILDRASLADLQQRLDNLLQQAGRMHQQARILGEHVKAQTGTLDKVAAQVEEAVTRVEKMQGQLQQAEEQARQIQEQAARVSGQVGSASAQSAAVSLAIHIWKMIDSEIRRVAETLTGAGAPAGGLHAEDVPGRSVPVPRQDDEVRKQLAEFAALVEKKDAPEYFEELERAIERLKELGVGTSLNPVQRQYLEWASEWCEQRKEVVKLIDQWDSVQAVEGQLNELLGKTNDLIYPRPLRLPAAYLRKLAEVLEKACGRLMGRLSGQRELLVWLRILYLKVRNAQELSASIRPLSPPRAETPITPGGLDDWAKKVARKVGDRKWGRKGTADFTELDKYLREVASNPDVNPEDAAYRVHVLLGQPGLMGKIRRILLPTGWALVAALVVVLVGVILFNRFSKPPNPEPTAVPTVRQAVATASPVSTVKPNVSVGLQTLPQAVAVVGREIHFIFTVRNAGSVPEKSMELFSQIPAGTEFRKTSPPAQFDGSEVRWAVEELAAGQTSSFTLTVMVGQDRQAGENIRSAKYGIRYGDGQVLTGTKQVSLVVEKPELKQIEMTVDPGWIPADGATKSIVTVRALDQVGSLLVEEPVVVTFSLQDLRGRLGPQETVQTRDGTATVYFTASLNAAEGPLTITARTGSLSCTGVVELVPAPTGYGQLTQMAHLYREADENTGQIIIFQLPVDTPVELLGDTENGFRKVAVYIWVTKTVLEIEQKGWAAQMKNTGCRVMVGNSPEDALNDTDAEQKLQNAEGIRVLIDEMGEDWIRVRVVGWVLEQAISFQ